MLARSNAIAAMYLVCGKRRCRHIYQKAKNFPTPIRKTKVFVTILFALVLLLILTTLGTHVGKTITSRLSGVLLMAVKKPRVTVNKCVHPVMDPFDPLIMRHQSKVAPVICIPAMADWVYVINGTLRISPDAIRLYGNISCQYEAIQRRGDFSVSYSQVVTVLDGMPLVSDFFRVNCTSSRGQHYSNVHAGVARNATVMKRLHDYHSAANKNHSDRQSGKGSVSQTFSSFNLSVFMLGLDAVSHMAWIRLMPKTRQYFLNVLGGIELENYNIVGDGTIAALLPILTGKTEQELPDARRGYKNATNMDNFPWIWKDFVKHGYVTAYAEDYPYVGTFQWRLLGFGQQPTDHYLRPFYLAVSALSDKSPTDKHSVCQGSLKRHNIFMNWFKDLFVAYRGFPKFFFAFLAEMSHDSNNQLQNVDSDLKIFLQDLEAKGFLNSTLLILMADHGAKYNSIRKTDIGKLEERLPHFSFRFPPWFHKLHPEIVQNLRINAKRLTTPFDIHVTFRHVLNLSYPSTDPVDKRSFSLFQKVPKERTCDDADIAPHWCACLEWQPLNKSNRLVVLAANTAIRAINSYTLSKRRQCAELTLLEITKSIHYIRKSEANWNVLKFFSKPMHHSVQLYQVSFKTLPGEGHFEVTCAVDPTNGTVLVDPTEISRINKYGSQPACVQQDFPFLRPYCYCV